ncbi:uncharacterized protein EKO05_0002058 [Ascochyta rabiei]|uniref:Flavin adenine dinucleotide binding n=1 Tax=Didymella rabiei TaxID=5454 RepID=A0A163LQV6_DIDRA|nr:uncharacterized protein EKO05_0002058 [Ascochyta rabiei]KZM28025.1 flavin adenine dinucleotide binding [Ascochyta rabiei]UPX11452.1 hypothetical protein EKO05_0002058 [Ascochyta rabiei]
MLHSQLLLWPLASVSRSCLATRLSAIEQAITELRPLLSTSAVISLPNTTQFTKLQIRASSPRISPSYSAIIEVATEGDVKVVVKVANRHVIPFLAISGAHGWTRTLNSLEDGIQINLRQLNTTVLSNDGKTASVGGGTLQYEITRALFEEGKYAVTGLCECVSVAGPLLGGGHSLLQNQHGYALDNLVSARVVIASGELVEVSNEKNADLFWALRGAGHNFGIVTSLVLKTYDIPSNWTVHMFVYTTDKLEALFDLINGFETPGTQRSTKLALTGVFVKLPDVDPVNPVILYNVMYEGSAIKAEPYAAPFKALGPTSTTVNNVNYIDIYKITSNDLSSTPCVRNRNMLGVGTSLPSWDLEGVRNAFNIFRNLTEDPRFSSSITLLENYGMVGVRAVDPDMTALAPQEREYPILASPVLWWDGDVEKDASDAYAYTVAIKNALYSGIDSSSEHKRHCYVNYANGEEPQPELYGYEHWRLARLRKLKRVWDPKNRFSLYNPIVL